MGSPLPSTSKSEVAALTVSEVRELQAIASAPLPALKICTDEGFARCMAMLDILPRRRADELAGSVMLAAYRRKLGSLPNQQMTFIVDEALGRCKWFPTIAELLEISAEWRRDDEAVRAKGRAEVALRNDRQARYDAAMAALRRGELDAAAIAALPLPWAESAARLGWLVRVEGGFAYPKPVVAQEGEAA